MRYEVVAGVGFDTEGKPIPQDVAAACIRRIVKDAAQLFGGVTVRRGEGGWIDPKGEYVEEPVVVITVDVAPHDVSHKEKAEELATIAKGLLRQTAVHVTQLVTSSHLV